MNTDKHKLVSIIMPCYNEERYVLEAIETLLVQTYQWFELIIVDDGSSDATWPLLESLAAADSRVCLFRNRQNKGVIHSLNKAIALCRGTYIARMDADDLSCPTRLEKQVAYLDSHPDIAMVSTLAIAIDGKRRFLRHMDIARCYTPIDLSFIACWGNPIIHPSIMIRGNTLRENGYQDSKRALHVEDYELWLRLLDKKESIAILPEYLLSYRLLSSGVSQRYAGEQFSNAVALAVNQLDGRLGLKMKKDDMAVMWGGVWALKDKPQLIHCFKQFDRAFAAYQEAIKRLGIEHDWGPMLKWRSERKLKTLWLSVVRSNMEAKEKFSILFLYLPMCFIKGFHLRRLGNIYNQARFQFLYRLYRKI